MSGSIIIFYSNTAIDTALRTVSMSTDGTFSTATSSTLYYLSAFESDAYMGQWVTTSTVALSPTHQSSNQIQIIDTTPTLNFTTGTYTSGPLESQFGSFLGTWPFYSPSIGNYWSYARKPDNTFDILWYSPSGQSPTTASFWFPCPAFPSGGAGTGGDGNVFPDPANSKIYSFGVSSGTSYMVVNNITTGAVISTTSASSLLTVSNHDRISDRSGCLGTDGNLYVNTYSVSNFSTTIRISQINPATPVETAAFTTSLYANTANWGSTDQFILAPFKIGSTNYIAIAEDDSSVAPNFEIVNADTKASVTTGTYTSTDNNTMLVAGSVSGSTASMFLLTYISGTTASFQKITYTTTGATLNFSTVKSYAPTDIDAGWSFIGSLSSLQYDASDGNIIFAADNGGNGAYLLKANSSTGAVIWKIPIPSDENSYLSVIPAKNDLSAGKLVFPVAAGGVTCSYQLSAGEASYLTITTSDGSYTSSVNDHFYFHGASYYDSVNQRIIYWDGGYSDGPTWTSGFSIFTPTTAVNVNYWNQNIISPVWTSSTTSFNFIYSMARAPMEPQYVYFYAVPRALYPGLGPLAIAKFNTSTGALVTASIVQNNFPVEDVSIGDNLRANPGIISPDGSSLFYYHTEGAGTASFSTTVFVQKVDPSTLALVTASLTPSAAGNAGSAPWNQGIGMPDGPYSLISSKTGKYVFGIWNETSSSWTGSAYVLWNTSDGSTHYGVTGDISGVTSSLYVGSQTYSIFDDQDRLWIAFTNSASTVINMVALNISGSTLSYASGPFTVSNAAAFGLLFVPGVTSAAAAYYIERMDNRIWPTVEDAWCLDAALAYPMPTPAATLTASTTSGTGTFIASAGVFTASDAGSILRMGGGVATVVTYNSSTSVAATITTPITEVYPNDPFSTPIPATAGNWTLTVPTMTVSGLDHLEGMTVAALADGAVVSPLTVVAGTVTLTTAATAITVGLPFTAQLQTLYLEAEGANTLQSKRKNVVRATLRVQNSVPPQIGTNQPDSSVQPNQATVAWGASPYASLSQITSTVTTGTQPLYSGDFQITNVFDNWGTNGQIAVQQSNPVPLTVLALVPWIDAGDQE